MKTTTTKTSLGMITITAVLANAVNSQCQTIIRVPQDQPTIQAAISAAVDGDTVLVSNGTYQEHDITIINAITLKSVNGSTATTIDAQGLGVILSANSTSPNWVKIQGFTLTGGYAPHGHSGGGNGVSWEGGFLEVSNCIIQNCTGDGVPGGNNSGLAYWDNIRFVDCVVRNNSVENYAGIGAATVIHCLLYGNSGWNNTSVLLACDSYNCTIANNGGGVLGNAWTTGGMTGGKAVNCILWGNDGHNGQQLYLPDSVTYSIVQGGYAGTGNLSLDPLFVNAANGDFRLNTNSPGIDAGDPAPIYNDADGSRADIGAFPFLYGLSVFNIGLTSYQQSTSKTSGQITTTPSPKAVKYSTTDILDMLAFDENLKGSWLSNSFPATATLAIAGQSFVVLDGGDILMNVADIIRLSGGDNNVTSGKHNNATGLASPSENRRQVVKIDFDDTSISGGKNFKFYLQGLLNQTTTDTPPVAGVYTETVTAKITSGAGEGSSKSVPFVCTGNATFGGTVLLLQ